MNHRHLYRNTFVQFLLWNYVFFGLQLAYILSRNRGFIHTIALPNLIYLEWVFTLVMHLCLYLLLSVVQTMLLWGILQYSSRYTDRWQVTIWALSILSLLFSNAYFFPLSAFGRLFLSELPSTVRLVGLLIPTLPLGLLAMNALLLMVWTHPKTLALIALPFAVVLFWQQIKPMPAVQLSPKTNIIVIGVDSLAPTAMSLHNTPEMIGFTQNAVLFQETISPLARTFPAWSSILTGLYPQHHHAHYNLMPQGQTNSSASIAWDLQKAGFETIFATDERRFSTIDKDFGFQRVVGPRLGVNDHILGTFNDFPLSNLLMNAPISRMLFPYNYMNRASYFSYYPSTFDNALRHTLISRVKTTPLFLAVHFTLPHWPYAYAASAPTLVKNKSSLTEREQLFSETLQRTDKQVARLLHTLETLGYLENSLIILLSDHGETFYTPVSRQTEARHYQGQGPSPFVDYLKRKTSTTLERSSGHGSDLLSATQYHCLLAFKMYQHGQLISIPSVIKTRVSLIDIAPTIQDRLHLPARVPVDGISLLKVFRHPATPLPARAFIMESGMLPNQCFTHKKIQESAKKYYSVNRKNGQIRLKYDKLGELDAMKLYGMIEGDWVLAMYPDNNEYIPVIQRLSDGAWDDKLTGAFAHASPALRMLNQMQRFYGLDWIAIKIIVKGRATIVKNNREDAGFIKHI